MTNTHEYHYVAYPWCSNGIKLYMRNESFIAAFCGSFPVAIDPRMDMESARYWFDRASKAGIVYW